MAAPIITCPACTKKFKGKEGLEGRRIKCPLCATPFVVPAAASEQFKAGVPGAKPGEDGPIKLQDETAGPAKGASQQRVTWNKEDENSAGYKLGEFDIRTRCPNCANLMEGEEAVVCIYCGYNTQTRQWGETIKTIGITGGQHFVHLLPGFLFLTLLIACLVGLLWYCVKLPGMVQDTWASFLDHESMRMWIIGIILGFMWAFGALSYKRLVVNPKPKEIEKEKKK